MKCVKCGDTLNPSESWILCLPCHRERARLYIRAQVGLMGRLAQAGCEEAKKRRVEYLAELQEQGR